jgi:hypothetical protein
MTAFKRGGVLGPILQDKHGNQQPLTATVTGSSSTVVVGELIIASDDSVSIGREIDPSGLLGPDNVLYGQQISYEGAQNVAIGNSTTVAGNSVALGYGATCASGQCVLGGPNSTQWILGQPGTLTVQSAANDAGAAGLGIPIGGIYQITGSSALALRKV